MMATKSDIHICLHGDTYGVVSPTFRYTARYKYISFRKTTLRFVSGFHLRRMSNGEKKIQKVYRISLRTDRIFPHECQ